ncbi:hypothetical protein ABPG74_013102 [Tetrahymena malaccensis]
MNNFKRLFALLGILISIKAEWKTIQLTGDVPNNLVYHESVEYVNAAGSQLVLLFGGQMLNGNILNQNIYQIDIQKYQVTKITPGGSVMTGRTKFASCSIVTPSNTYVFLHGGYCVGNSFCGDFYKYDVAANTYQTLTNTLSRAEHSIICDSQNNKVWLFGGKSSTSVMNDLWQYDITNNAWKLADYNIFSMVVLNVVLWDGSTASVTINKYSDYLQISPSDLSKLQQAPPTMILFGGPYDCSVQVTQMPSCRSNYSFVKKQNDPYLYLIGGQDASGIIFQDIWKYDITNKAWIQPQDGLPSTYTQFFTQQSATLSYSQDFTFLFGGYNGSNYSTNGFARSFSNGKISQLKIPQYSTQVAPQKVVGYSINSFQSGITMTGGCEDKTLTSSSCAQSQLSFYILGISDCNQASTNHNQAKCLYGKHWCLDQYWGDLCQNLLCPGSMCLNDINSFESPFCYMCFGNGQCTQSGQCTQCSQTQAGIGFISNDCSTVDCKNQCGNAGTCVNYYPVSSCNCQKLLGGDYCGKTFCLNDCSNSGVCQQNGQCQCNQDKEGADCSIQIIGFLS